MNDVTLEGLRDELEKIALLGLPPALSMGGLSALTGVEASNAMDKSKSRKERVKSGIGAAGTGAILASEVIPHAGELKGLAKKGLSFVKKAETEKERAKRYGRNGAGIAAGLAGLHYARNAPLFREASKVVGKKRMAGMIGVGLATNTALGYGAGRLTHRIAHGKATDKKVKTSAPMTPDMKSMAMQHSYQASAKPAAPAKPMAMPTQAQHAARSNMMQDFMPAGKFQGAGGSMAAAAKAAPVKQVARAAPAMAAKPMMSAARSAAPKAGGVLGKALSLFRG